MERLVIVPQSWSSPHIRGVKRRLSVFEKSSLSEFEGRALILSGEPPRQNEHGETEELIQAGFRPEQIVIVEKDSDIAVALYNHYYDTVAVHNDYIEAFLPKARATYSYIHVDFCGYLGAEVLDGIQSWRTVTTPYARIRFSAQRSRRMPKQIEYENSLRRMTLLSLCEQASLIDENPQRWVNMYEHFDSGDDTTQVIVGIWLLNFLFGLSVWEYGDLCTENPSVLPPAKGNHRIARVRRYNYNDLGSRTAMCTAWVDLIPLADDAHISPDQWLVDEMAHVLHPIIDIPPSFNNPSLYTEEPDG